MQIYNTMMYFSHKVEKKNMQIYNTMMYFSRKIEKKIANLQYNDVF